MRGTLCSCYLDKIIGVVVFCVGISHGECVLLEVLVLEDIIICADVQGNPSAFRTAGSCLCSSVVDKVAAKDCPVLPVTACKGCVVVACCQDVGRCLNGQRCLEDAPHIVGSTAFPFGIGTVNKIFVVVEVTHVCQGDCSISILNAQHHHGKGEQS